jgi:hypothetical protein
VGCWSGEEPTGSWSATSSAVGEDAASVATIISISDSTSRVGARHWQLLYLPW